MKDELKEGDQILVKCLALDGNKIKLSRRAVLREQREKREAEKASKGGGKSKKDEDEDGEEE